MNELLRKSPNMRALSQEWFGQEHMFLIEKLLTIVAILGLMGVAFPIWSAIIAIPSIGALSVVGTAFGLWLVAMTYQSTDPKQLKRTQLLVLLLSLIMIVGWAIRTLYFHPVYGTDEAAYDQYAAMLFSQQGIDPYTANLIRALTLFRVPIQYATYTLNGGIASRLAYPDLSFLLIIPFLWIADGTQAAILASLFFYSLSITVGFFLVPRMARPLIIIAGVGLPILFGFSVAGINDFEFMPFLLYASFQWMEWGQGTRLTRRDWFKAVSFGLACSVQQLPWFFGPFLLVGIFRVRQDHAGTRKALRRSLQYFAIVSLIFITTNFPFIIWHPIGWLEGCLRPLIQAAIPYGQGIIDIPIFFHIGGGNLKLFSDTALLLYASFLFIYYVNFSHMYQLTFVLPSIALFFPTRSLAEYFLTLVLVWIVSMYSSTNFSTVIPTPKSNRLIYLSLLPGAIALLWAVATPSPLKMQLLSVQSNGELQKLWSVRVRVTNRTDHKMALHFAANYSGQMTSFWNTTQSDLIGPYQQKIFNLSAPNVGSMPGVTTPFMIQAVTATPTSISSTNTYIPQKYLCSFNPEYFNKVYPLGARVTLSVQLRTPFGAKANVGGVRVALGQVIYGQSDLIPATSRINNGYEGQSPIVEETNGRGQAIFHISENVNQHNPIYFQAWVTPRNGYPYGYSPIISVLWR